MESLEGRKVGEVIGLIAASIWLLFTVLFGLAVMAGAGAFLAGFLFFLMGAVFFPPALRLLEKSGVRLPLWSRFVAAFVLLIGVMVAMPHKEELSGQAPATSESRQPESDTQQTAPPVSPSPASPSSSGPKSGGG